MEMTPPEGAAALIQMFQGAHASAAVAGAVQLGLFGALDGGPLELERVAERIGCPARSTGILCDALRALGLLEREGERYRLAPLAAAHLVPGRLLYVGDVANILCSPMVWEGLGRFTEAVRSGGTVLSSHAETPEQPFWEIFARSSAALAVPAALVLEGLVHDFLVARPQARVLDVAAGSGIYGYTLAARHPGLSLTALDWPNVLVETRGWAPRMGVDAARVRYLAGNLFEVDWSGPYDLIVMSHVFHHFDVPTCQGLTRKAAAALAPGGRLALHDFLTDDDNPAALMFSIIMLLWTHRGQAYASADYRRWLDAAGLPGATVHPSPGLPTAFVVAERPPA
jgi:C-methyltransferase